MTPGGFPIDFGVKWPKVKAKFEKFEFVVGEREGGLFVPLGQI